MHIHFLDPYQERNSLIHRLDARVKFALTLVFILTVALTPHGAWPVYIILFSLVLAVEVVSEIGVGYVLKRASLALPFVMAAFPVIFTLEGPVLARLPLGPWVLTIYQPGLERFISIALKSWISVQAAIILATSTPFPELLSAMRAVRIPRLLVAIFGLMWRYLFVLADETLRMIRARSSRSGESDQPGLKKGGSLIWRARVTGAMAGSLFLRAFERSDRIYTAMLSRGYNGEVRAQSLPSLNRFDWLVFYVITALFIALLSLALLFWG
ncbi:MAG TPA: cobalt ECF transporter T component CbiQ [Anaerolineales bacterium]|nr:cobalt ECF transporter T component CbiQ [Anaerolineales bacterium]